MSNMAGGFDQEEEAARVYDLAHPLLAVMGRVYSAEFPCMLIA